MPQKQEQRTAISASFKPKQLNKTTFTVNRRTLATVCMVVSPAGVNPIKLDWNAAFKSQ